MDRWIRRWVDARPIGPAGGRIGAPRGRWAAIRIEDRPAPEARAGGSRAGDRGAAADEERGRIRAEQRAAAAAARAWIAARG